MSKLCGTIKHISYEDSLKYLTSHPYILTTNLTAKSTPHSPVLISKTMFEKYHKDEVYNRSNRDIGVWQGSFLTAYLIGLALLSGISKLTKTLYFRSLGTRSLAKPSKFMLLLQKYISFPALFGYIHAKKFVIFGVQITFPTRMESLGIFGYCALYIIFATTHYFGISDNNFIYGKKKLELLRFIADRTGIMATVQLPILTLFALRNNFLLYLSGWSFSTFNAYHRSVSRMFYLSVIVHATVFHGYYLYNSSIASFFKADYYWSGVCAIGSFGIAIGAASFRHYFYDVFLIIHVVFVLLALVMAILHISDMGYIQAVYLTFAFWAMDWLLRFCNIMRINISLFSGRNNKIKSTRAEMSVVGDQIVMNIDTPLEWKVKPGQYVFVYIASLNPWECHPFSPITSDDSNHSFKLVTKIQNGLTKKLARRLAKSQSPATYKVAIEGPYGETAPVERYDSSILIAGGAGITGVLPYAEKLSKMDIQQHTQFIWTTRHLDSVKIISKPLQDIMASGRVEVKIYVSEESMPVLYNQNKEKVSSEVSSFSDSSTDLCDTILGSITFGARPDIPQLISSNFEQATGSIAILSCGPGDMMDSIREQICTDLDKVKNGRVEYFEHAFNW
ncbi:hypothetical protein NADFUDRAFT_24231 [Nadsonia fulvescens var. elongata DSM 6958]|uniref:ferric-chelate reductase (NADPH) n=1 Tax=Nadsonia fulvescens var. elongata DSM 6958 TaxID=857566 RepID=A0A1E3PKQ4_9ASCO|nr:hypothetical protein NADFUDRAFT_24231 [Nadsonia fulvescens var. elongata DSM 6958]